MPQHLSIGKLFRKPVHQFSHCLALFFRAVVLRLAFVINPTNVTDVDAIMVMPFHPVAGFNNRPVVNDCAVPFNDKMVAGSTPVQHLSVIAVNAVSRGRYVAGCGVQYDLVNWSHLQMGLVE